MKLLDSTIVGFCVTVVLGLVAYGFVLLVKFSARVDPVYTLVLLFILVFITCTLVSYSLHK